MIVVDDVYPEHGFGPCVQVFGWFRVGLGPVTHLIQPVLDRGYDALVADGVNDIANRCFIGARKFILVEPPDHGNVIGVGKFARPEQVRVSRRARYFLHDHLALGELVEGEDVLPLAAFRQDLDGVVVAEDDVVFRIENIVPNLFSAADSPDGSARVHTRLYFVFQPQPDSV